MLWLLTIAFLLGIPIGCMFGKASRKYDPVGVLRIDNSDPYDGPHLFVEIHKNPKMLKFEKYVTFEVSTESYLSQEKQSL